MSSKNISSYLTETREFLPSQGFSAKARISSFEEYQKIYDQSIKSPEDFWAQKARELLTWESDFSKTLSWSPPYAKWFEDGKINASVNCLDVHLKNNKDKKALIWEAEDGATKSFTFYQLHRKVCQLANALKKLGVDRGDRVTLYMPMVPEAVISMLACSRIGAPHNVVFAGFSSDALAERIKDSQSKLVITSDGLYRRGQIVPIKTTVDQSLTHSPSVENVIVLKRTESEVTMTPGRDHWWHEAVDPCEEDCPAEAMNSEDMLFMLYTSGSTGKPKGILHSTAGYLLGTKFSFQQVFDYQEKDVFWCTADVGWITGHSYLVYGPLSNGATIVMYEGAPDYPNAGRFWSLIEKHKVSVLYTAPTAIRAFMKHGDDLPKKSDLSSLRLLGTVGEPINPKAWLWYHQVIGGGRCPIVDTWWQTETGMIMITPIPGATPTTPGSATRPFFGVDADVVDDQGQSLPADQGGYLVMKKPWPSMLRTIYGDSKRYEDTYWSKFGNMYLTGDGARRDKSGNIWIMGRIDDVINVSGHRLSTMEIESSLVSHPSVTEAAVVGCPHEIKGEAIVCFVTIANGIEPNGNLNTILSEHVCEQIGKLAKPERIILTKTLPKTRSGKIMRRLLREIAAGNETKGDISTLEDMGVLQSLRQENPS